jgi:hypothetical protein
MSRSQVISGLKNSQKIRVIVGDVGIYITVGQTDTVFATTKHRLAVQHTLHLMVSESCGGISHTVKVFDENLSSSEVSVQVDLL